MIALTLENEALVKLLHEGSASKPLRVCFVCTGNTCRSPMAAAVANAFSQGGSESSSEKPETLQVHVLATSRGLYAEEGAPISENAVLALEELGVRPCPDADYHRHTARTIDEEDARANDLLVAVSRRHANELLFRFPFAASKIICMPCEITDPWGGDLSCYHRCLADIIKGVAQLFVLKGETK